MLPLITDRLELRDFQRDDFPAVHAYASDPLVTRFTAFGPNSEEETRAFLDLTIAGATAQPRRDYTLAVVHRPGNLLIGGCGLMSRRYQEYEIGYVLHRDWWGRGIGAELARALVAFGFGKLGAHRIYAGINPENPASCRLLERLGFRLEGHQRQDLFARGEWHDSLVFAMLAEEFASRADRDDI